MYETRSNCRRYSAPEPFLSHFFGLPMASVPTGPPYIVLVLHLLAGPLSRESRDLGPVVQVKQRPSPSACGPALASTARCFFPIPGSALVTTSSCRQLNVLNPGQGPDCDFHDPRPSERRLLHSSSQSRLHWHLLGKTYPRADKQVARYLSHPSLYRGAALAIHARIFS